MNMKGIFVFTSGSVPGRGTPEALTVCLTELRARHDSRCVAGGRPFHKLSLPCRQRNLLQGRNRREDLQGAQQRFQSPNVHCNEGRGVVSEGGESTNMTDRASLSVRVAHGR